MKFLKSTDRPFSRVQRMYTCQPFVNDSCGTLFDASLLLSSPFLPLFSGGASSAAETTAIFFFSFFFFTALICLSVSITISRLETTLSIFARKTSGHRTYVRRNRSSPLFTLLFLPFHRGTTLPSPVDAKLPLTGSLAPNEITSSVRGEKTPGFGETIERSLHLQRRLTVSGKFDLKGGQTNRARYDTFSVVERKGRGSNFPRGRTRVTNKRGKLS